MVAQPQQAPSTAQVSPTAEDDPYLWLEDVSSEQALPRAVRGAGVPPTPAGHAPLHLAERGCCYHRIRGPQRPGDWEFVKQYSPYHNIRSDRLPADPDHQLHQRQPDPPRACRKMAAALKEAGHRVLYYENTEGGHGGVSNNAQAAFTNALMYEFLNKELVINRRSEP